MKRKRGRPKSKPKKSSLEGTEKPYPNVVTENMGDNPALDDFDTAETDCGMEVDTPVINLDELVDKTVRQSLYDPARVNLGTSNLDYQLTPSNVPLQSDTYEGSQRSALGKQGVVTETVEDSANPLPEMKTAISENTPKKAGSVKKISSRGLGSSSINHTSNAEPVQFERPCQKEPNIPQQDPQYNVQELNAALAVIKKVMKMGAAESFNAPVNPIALGIHDYFDVIDTPMDFGTVCRNLENSVKYMNSEDVFKDVQYIWDNCSKYNNEGDYIIKLMKRVKKNFMKYWTAAGLYSEQPSKTNDSAGSHSRHVSRCSVGDMNRSPSQPQTLQPLQPPPSYGQPPQTQLSSGLLQHSQRHIDSAGHSPLLPCTDTAMSCSRHVPRCPAGLMIGSSNQHWQDQSGISQPPTQEPPPSYSQLQPSQLHASSNTAQSYLLPPTDSPKKHSRRLPRCPVGPMASNPSQQQWDLSGPSNLYPLQHQQPPASYIHPNQPQLSSSQLQPSPAIDTGSAGHSHLPPPMDSAMGCSRCVHRCPDGSVTDNISKQCQGHLGWNHHQQPPPSYSQPYQPHLSSGQPWSSADFGTSRNKYVSRCSVGPMSSNPSKQDQFSHPQPHESLRHTPVYSQPYPPQSSSSRPQPSPPQAGTDNDYAMRHKKYVPRCPVGPMSCNPSQQDKSGSSHPHPDETLQHTPGYCQPYLPQSNSSRPQAGTDNDSAMRRDKYVPRCPVGSMSSNRCQQGQSGSSQHQPHQPLQHTPGYSQPYQPQSSSSQPQPFQPQAEANNALRRSRRVARCSMGPMASNPSQQRQEQDQSSPRQPQPQQPLLGFSQPYQPQTSSNMSSQSQMSSGQLQSSQPQVGTATSRAGHSHLPPPTVSATKCSGCVPGYEMGPSTDNPSQQQQDQLGANQIQPQHAQPSYNQPCQWQQTSSQSQPSLPESSTDTDTSENKRRTRGPTRCLSLWSRREGERMSIPINKLGQPIGPKAPKLSNFLGTIARNGRMLPLTYVDWRGMPDATKENMWQVIETKFDINPRGKTWVLRSLGKKWKDWKAELKAKHYNTHKTDEERLADCDERVLPDQWAILISFWNSDEGKMRSATNRANCLKSKVRHHTGTKSFARLREEERKKRPNGKEPTDEELFLLTHTPRNGKPVDEAKLVAIQSRLREQAAQQSKTSQGNTHQDGIFSQVTGEDKHGRGRTYGLGLSPDEILGTTPGCAEALKMASEAKRLADEEVRQMREKMESMEQKYSLMEAQMAKMMSAIQRRYPEEHMPDPLVTRQAFDASNAPETQQQVHSSSSSHPVPSHELLYELQKSTTKKGKTRNRRKVKVARTAG